MAVGVAALGGIAAILGWLPEQFNSESATSTSATAPRISGTAPPESLSPGESVVTSPAPAPPSGSDPGVRPRGQTPISPPAAAQAPKAEAPAARPVPPEERAARRPCANCGIVSSTTYHQRDAQGGAFEVRVRFDDGTRLTLRFPTNPGFRVGERVFFSDGRLRRP